MTVDYSLYLVTDSTPAILGDKDLATIVEQAIEGGVTIVQYRDKKSETADLIRIGKRLHAIAKKNNVPLLINDRVDVAQAVGAEGVHLGQEDMSECAMSSNPIHLLAPTSECSHPSISDSLSRHSYSSEDSRSRCYDWGYSQQSS